MNMKNALVDSRGIEGGYALMGDKSAPSFIDTAGASLGYKYNPVIDHFKEVSTFGTRYSEYEEGFIASKNIPEDLKEYSTSLVTARSQDHMDFLANSMRKNLTNREIIERSSLGVQFAVELLDPVNYVALPFASVNKLRSVGSAALRTGAGTATVVGAQEAIRAPFDTVGTSAETAMNIGSSFLIGAALGGAVSVPASRRLKAQKDAEREIQNLRDAIEPIEGVEFDPNIADSVFTNSWLFKGVTTPMKRTLQNTEIPNDVKLTMLEIANDAGILLAGNKVGMALKNSVFQNAKLREGEWVQTYDRTLQIWGESTGDGVTKAMDRMVNRAQYEDWLTSVDQKAMRGETPANDFEARAIEELNSFYASWEKRLNEQGMFGNKGFFLKDISARETVIADLEAELGVKGMTMRTKERDAIQAVIKKNKLKITERKAAVAEIDSSGPTMPANEEIFRPRYWDKTYIRDNREALEDILFNWFTENPAAYNKRADGQYGKTELSTRPSDVRGRAVFAVDSILGLKDVTDFDVASFGHGKSKHMKHRGIDIPNKLVLDFIHKNPVSIMKAYTARTAPKYEFSKQFGGRSIDDVLDGNNIQMIKSGVDEDGRNAVLKDIRHMHDRVAGTVLREPDAMNQTVARLMRSAAQLSYLGAAGVSTITEPAKIMMEHGVGKSFKGLLAVLKDQQLVMGAKEARIAGEALEMLMGNAHLRLVEDMGNNPLRADFLDKATDVFFTLNGLGPITRLFKDFDGMMRSHTLIDYSVRLTQGKASKMETEYLARYGVDKAKAKKIADSSWQKSESGMYMADSESWVDIDMALVRKDVKKSYKPSTKPIIKSKPFVDQPVEPELSFESKIEKINTRISELEEAEINAIKKGQTSEGDKLAKQINDAEKLRTNANVSLAEEVRKAKQAEKESQDYYESMQPGFEPDRKILKDFLDREQKAIQSAKALQEEIKDLDSAIENLEAGTKAEFELQNIVDKDSSIAKQRDDISKELSDLYEEITAREFLNENGIDYDNLTLDQQKRAYKLDREEQIANMSDDDSEFGPAIAKSAEEARNKEVAELKESAEAASKAKPRRVTQPPSELMPEQELLKRFGQEFYVDRIITDQEIVDGVFTGKGTPNILGSAVDTGLESPATVYLNIENIRSSYNKFKNREDLDAFTEQLDNALAEGSITEAAHAHQMTYVKNADLLETEDDFVRFVMMHELHHTTHFKEAGETLAQYEKRIDDLAMSYMRNERKDGLELAIEKERATRAADARETQKTFRNALSSGIANTILMGTPADKPIITDGVAYIPMRVAEKFGMKEDAKYKGYSRIENGLLGMPFQFYSYALAAVNKTTAAMAHGQVKNQYLGSAIAMGLGYMVLQIKTPNYVEMEYHDQFARAFDYSGLASIYSDLFYTAMSTTLAMGGGNITGGLIAPRYPQKPNKIDAATGLLGAGPSIVTDLTRGAYEMVTGDVGKGSKEFVRSLPYMRLWFLKGFINNMTNAMETELDGPSGFKRY